MIATNNFVWRGYSKSNGEFAIQTNMDFEHESGLFLGASISTVDFGDDAFDNRANVEITPYLGWTFSLPADWRFDMQWTRYLYDGGIFGRQTDYNEFYFLLHYSDLVSAGISFSEDFYNQGKASADYAINGRYPITDKLQFSTGIGYSQTKKILKYDYLYWNAGLTYFFRFVALDFRYMDATELNSLLRYDMYAWQYSPKVIDPSFVFSISIGF